MVDLSTADSNKWLTLLKARSEGKKPDNPPASDYQLLGPLRQRHRRLTEAQVAEMTKKYKAGATVYELAAEFGCHRTTVAERLKKAGIVMRLQSPEALVIESMERLYQSGLSYPEIGRQLGCAANTVRKYLQARDPHG